MFAGGFLRLRQGGLNLYKRWEWRYNREKIVEGNKKRANFAVDVSIVGKLFNE